MLKKYIFIKLTVFYLYKLKFNIIHTLPLFDNTTFPFSVYNKPTTLLKVVKNIQIYTQEIYKKS